MLDFIDTSLFNKDSTIKVTVYSDDRDRAKQKVLSLIEGENVLEKRVYYAGMKVLIEKNELKILVMAVPLSESAKGYRTTYSLIDKNIFNMKLGNELFFKVIGMANVVYDHLLSEEKIRPNVRYILF